MGLGSGIVPGTVGGGTKVIMALPVQSVDLTYNGSAQSPTWGNYRTDQLTITATSQTNAGEYTATATPKNDCRWFDGTTGAKTLKWSIGRQVISNVPSQKGSLTFDGTAKTPTWNNDPGSTASFSNNTAVSAGTHTAYVTPDSNHCWSSGSYEPKAVLFVIGKASVTAPTVTGTSLTYNGTAQSPTISSYDTSLINIGGEIKTNAGNYSVTMSLIDKVNYQWSDGTSETKNVSWSIAKATGSLSATSTVMLNGGSNSSVDVILNMKSDGTIKVRSGHDTQVCTVTVHQHQETITITGVKTGMTTVTIGIDNPSNYTAVSDIQILVYANIPREMRELLRATGDNSYVQRTYASWQTWIRSGGDANRSPTSLYKVGDFIEVPLEGTVKLLTLSGTYRATLVGIDHNPDFEASETEGGNRLHFALGAVADDLGNQTDIAFCDSKYLTSSNDFSYDGFQFNKTQTNSGGWQASKMRQETLNGETNSFWAAMPSDLKAIITACPKWTDNVGAKSTAEASVTSTSDKLWLFAPCEVFGATKGSVNTNPYEQNKQQQYAYWQNGNSWIRYKHDEHSKAVNWWLRSPSTTSTTYFRLVGYHGNTNNHNPAGWSFGVVPGFTIS